MRSNKYSRLIFRSVSLVLALFMLFSMFGCSMAEVAENAQLAGDIIDIVGELMEKSSENEQLPDSGGVGDYEYTEPSAESEPEPEVDSDTQAEPETEAQTEPETEAVIDRDGYYYQKDDVALYIYTYGELPANFITKEEAGELGWEGGSVERFLEGAAIGGDIFKNREGNLPKKSGRVYYECDIDTDGESSRGAKRIVFSNDGLIYYTGNHYETFTLLYGEE